MGKIYVNKTEILDGEVTEAKLADNAVTSNKIAAAAVLKSKLSESATYLSGVSITNATSPYAVAVTADIVVIDTSGGAVTITMPAAASFQGRTVILQKTSADLTVCTITGVTTLNTQGETVALNSDGANWLILERRIPSVWVAYTLSAPGWTGNITHTGKWRRVGDSAVIQVGSLASGGVTGTTYIADIPFTIDTAKLSAGTGANSTLPQSEGSFLDSGSNAYPLTLFYQSTTTVRAAYHAVSGSTIINTTLTATAPVTIASGDSVDISFTVPVAGWNG